MIDWISGTVCELSPTEVVIENGGIGHIALISVQTFSKLQGNSSATIYIHHILREDEELDYGFATKQEREMFRLLIGVSGVGAATARMMLSSLSSDELVAAILSEDVNKIKSVKGIGLKSAQKVIIELKDKVAKDGAAVVSGEVVRVSGETQNEACSALIALGFPKSNAAKAVSTIVSKDPSASVENIIKQALKIL